MLAYYDREIEEAANLLGEAVSLAREGTYKHELTRSLIALARVKRTLGQVVQAAELIIEASDVDHEFGRKLGVIVALDEWAAVYAVQNDAAGAVMPLIMAHTLRERLGAPLPPLDRAAYDSVVTICRTQLGETAFTSIWADASTRQVQEVVEEILRHKDVLYDP
jgi:hypothetical protein